MRLYNTHWEPVQQSKAHYVSYFTKILLLLQCRERDFSQSTAKHDEIEYLQKKIFLDKGMGRGLGLKEYCALPES